jgi:TonB family protein
VAAAPQPEPEPERPPVVVASAAPTPAPAAPLAAAAKAVEPPPPPQEEEEEPLKLLSKVNPTVPRQMQQQASFRSGFAQVQFTVGTDGSVQQTSVIKASHSRLGAAAMDAIKQWKFAPLRRPREAAVEIAFSNETE